MADHVLSISKIDSINAGPSIAKICIHTQYHTICKIVNLVTHIVQYLAILQTAGEN